MVPRAHLACALIVTPKEVLVRNYLRTYRLDWQDILRFTRGISYMGQRRSAAIRIEVRGRREIQVDAYGRGPFDPDDYADHVLLELELLLKDRAPDNVRNYRIHL